MRRFFPLINILALAAGLALPAAGMAAPLVVGRVGLVAGGQLPADSLTAGTRATGRR